MPGCRGAMDSEASPAAPGSGETPNEDGGLTQDGGLAADTILETGDTILERILAEFRPRGLATSSVEVEGDWSSRLLCLLEVREQQRASCRQVVIHASELCPSINDLETYDHVRLVDAVQRELHATQQILADQAFQLSQIDWDEVLQLRISAPEMEEKVAKANRSFLEEIGSARDKHRARNTAVKNAMQMLDRTRADELYEPLQPASEEVRKTCRCIIDEKMKALFDLDDSLRDYSKQTEQSQGEGERIRSAVAQSLKVNTMLREEVRKLGSRSLQAESASEKLQWDLSEVRRRTGHHSKELERLRAETARGLVDLEAIRDQASDSTKAVWLNKKRAKDAEAISKAMLQQQPATAPHKAGGCPMQEGMIGQPPSQKDAPRRPRPQAVDAGVQANLDEEAQQAAADADSDCGFSDSSASDRESPAGMKFQRSVAEPNINEAGTKLQRSVTEPTNVHEAAQPKVKRTVTEPNLEDAIDSEVNKRKAKKQDVAKPAQGRKRASVAAVRSEHSAPEPVPPKPRRGSAGDCASATQAPAARKSVKVPGAKTGLALPGTGGSSRAPSRCAPSPLPEAVDELDGESSAVPSQSPTAETLAPAEDLQPAKSAQPSSAASSHEPPVKRISLITGDGLNKDLFKPKPKKPPPSAVDIKDILFSEDGMMADPETQRLQKEIQALQREILRVQRVSAPLNKELEEARRRLETAKERAKLAAAARKKKERRKSQQKVVDLATMEEILSKAHTRLDALVREADKMRSTFGSTQQRLAYARRRADALRHDLEEECLLAARSKEAAKNSDALAALLKKEGRLRHKRNEELQRAQESLHKVLDENSELELAVLFLDPQPGPQDGTGGTGSGSDGEHVSPKPSRPTVPKTGRPMPVPSVQMVKSAARATVSLDSMTQEIIEGRAKVEQEASIQKAQLKDILMQNQVYQLVISEIRGELKNYSKQLRKYSPQAEELSPDLEAVLGKLDNTVVDRGQLGAEERLREQLENGGKYTQAEVDERMRQVTSGVSSTVSDVMSGRRQLIPADANAIFSVADVELGSPSGMLPSLSSAASESSPKSPPSPKVPPPNRPTGKPPNRSNVQQGATTSCQFGMDLKTESTVVLKCAPRQSALPPVKTASKKVASRTEEDLSPLSPDLTPKNRVGGINGGVRRAKTQGFSNEEPERRGSAVFGAKGGFAVVGGGGSSAVGPRQSGK